MSRFLIPVRTGGTHDGISLNISNPSGDDQTYVITFSGSPIIGGSLPDGAYDLTVHHNLVSDNATGSVLTGPDQTYCFYRLFGDAYGTGSVGEADYNLLRSSYNKHVGQSGYVSALDFDNSGKVDLTDYNAFMDRYGLSQSAMGTTDLYYSDQGQVIEEQQAGQTTTQYVWSPFYVNQLVERDDQPNSSGTLTRRLYVEQDANYNVTSLTNTSGAVVERYTYDPYGNVTVEAPNGQSRGEGVWASAYGMQYLFQGGRADPATGLYRFGVRDYDPATGRWLQQDPDGYINGPNTYQLELSDPTTLLDPSGQNALISLLAPLETAGEVIVIDGNALVLGVAAAGGGIGYGIGTLIAEPSVTGQMTPALRRSPPGDPVTQPNSPTTQPDSDPANDPDPDGQNNDTPGYADDRDPDPATDPQASAQQDPTQPQSSPAQPSGQQQTPTTTAGDDGSGQTETAQQAADREAAEADAAQRDAEIAMARDEDADPFHDPDKLHGNDLNSDAPAQGYVLRDADTGEPLKYGMTTQGDGRYTKAELDAMNAEINFVASGSVRDMRQWETDQILDYLAATGQRPPMNLNNH